MTPTHESLHDNICAYFAERVDDPDIACALALSVIARMQAELRTLSDDQPVVPWLARIVSQVEAAYVQGRDG